MNIKQHLKELFWFEVNAEPDGFMRVKKRREQIKDSLQLDELAEKASNCFFDWMERNKIFLEEMYYKYCKLPDVRIMPYHEYTLRVYNDNIHGVSNKEIRRKLK